MAKWINGYFLEDVKVGDTVYKKGTLVPNFAFLQDDGTTASGNWLYCGSYTEKGNMAARRARRMQRTASGCFPSGPGRGR